MKTIKDGKEVWALPRQTYIEGQNALLWWIRFYEVNGLNECMSELNYPNVINLKVIDALRNVKTYEHLRLMDINLKRIIENKKRILEGGGVILEI